MEELKMIPLVFWLLSSFFMSSVKKQVPEGQISEEKLTGREKFFVWIFSLFAPVLAGQTFYYGWRKKLPKKAKQANVISFVALFLLIAIYIGRIILIASQAGV